MLILVSHAFLASCGELKKTEPDTFFSETKPPEEQIFRWSNGKFPKSFDPALASAPPETDIVRAIYDGLTETDPETLEAVPALASRWESDESKKVWKFELRKDVYWSNGDKITAKDFVRSWKRAVTLGEKAPHHFLMHNFVGVTSERVDEIKGDIESGRGVAEESAERREIQDAPEKSEIGSSKEDGKTPKKHASKSKKLGVKAISDFSLEVRLKEPDEELPRLLAHPMFRPVFGDGENFKEDPVGADIVTNGAFRIASVGRDGVTLDRRENYYAGKSVKLNRVIFVPSKDADSALEMYKKGEVDVVTNSAIEPLAKKILTPYNDFRQTTHSALNLYEFNIKDTPFNDRRVRESLAMAIDREQIVKGILESSAKPAYDFLPFKKERSKPIPADPDAAKALFEKAGFADASEFPKIKLLINRNETQQKVAERVARMWKDVLGVETELVISEGEELEKKKKAGDYSLVRRGVVLPTSDETANMLALFGVDESEQESTEKEESDEKEESGDKSPDSDDVLSIDTSVKDKVVLTEEEAIAEIPAIPLYFPTSYSLVKPYVRGFVLNTLDAPSLKNVEIDSSWRPRKEEGNAGS